MGSILVKNLGKAYKQYPSRFGRLLEWVSPLSITRHSLKWVLNDISFEVKPGEAVGIIGINGAGKSTLLKMITGTTKPTTGIIQMTGRVAALLELGMGFHPDFTGRQNVYMAGQLLGFAAEEITAKMEEIEAFAEIGDAIDQPVRTYSSGMQVRLAFSVAIANRPDILIVDEALSVGDAYFQHKSFDRIREFRKQGTTLLIVSHDKGAIQSICDRAILLNKGKIGKEGSPEEVMDFYNALLADRQNQAIQIREISGGKNQTTSGTGEATVIEIALLDQKGNPVEIVDVGSSVELRVKVKIHQPIFRLIFGFMIKDRLGQPMYGTNTHLWEMPVHDLEPEDELAYNIKFKMNLGVGSYSIVTSLSNTDTHLVNNYEWRDRAFIFQVVNITAPHFEGCALLDPIIEVDKLNNSSRLV